MVEVAAEIGWGREGGRKELVGRDVVVGGNFVAEQEVMVACIDLVVVVVAYSCLVEVRKLFELVERCSAY